MSKVGAAKDRRIDELDAQINEIQLDPFPQMEYLQPAEALAALEHLHAQTEESELDGAAQADRAAADDDRASPRRLSRQPLTSRVHVGCRVLRPRRAAAQLCEELA
jgi:hypothetical protein